MHHHGPDCGHAHHDADAALLDMLTGPLPPSRKTMLSRRDAALDPLLMAAAFASGPHVTRHHYHHDFFPGVMVPQEEGGLDWTKFTGEDAGAKQERKRLTYVSRQAPRRTRVQQGLVTEDGKENDRPGENVSLKQAEAPSKKRRSSTAIVSPSPSAPVPAQKPLSESVTPLKVLPPVEVKCMARTRIPTPHGLAFLHLYHNNRDTKEHLAIVIDSAQLSDAQHSSTHIRSQSLDSVWSDTETDVDRITRGAYVGRLGPLSQHASAPHSHQTPASSSSNPLPAPLIRIHSECFTGETIGSMRCDCGEQLDEAIRQISQPVTPSSEPPAQVPGRGAVIYLRQEGRGIGLLSKIRAYNLQDLGHDTVTANLMLGHKADERGYEIAGAILRDLGLGSEAGEGVRVLTNNPDKISALEKEGVKIVERVPMVPRSWKARNPHLAVIPPNMSGDPLAPELKVKVEIERPVGATLIGGSAVYGEDLDKYLRTKVLRMGHMLPLWMEDPEAA
ncbi:hypothetical protein HGRIS_009352 [Hohenbuehelia grisea]|uniref:GTP cyclohydrolase II n=1 Tax=Hohenbuehelia grisea TaxID=104357 RepID=A0ABR3J189_9AGAR